MTEITCRACGEAKTPDAYERLPSSGLRGTCTTCRRAANAATKLRLRQEREASPEHQARMAQRQRESEEKAARKEAARAAQAEEEAEQAELRRQQREAARGEREERKAAMRDDIWAAMRLGRSRRAASAVKPFRSDAHRIGLKYGGGFISTAELACRCAEAEACSRAARSCTTFEDVAAAVRILEQPTPSVERRAEVHRLWRAEVAPQFPEGLLGLHECADDDDDDDPFAEAFGDWGPIDFAHISEAP